MKHGINQKLTLTVDSSVLIVTVSAASLVSGLSMSGVNKSVAEPQA